MPAGPFWTIKDRATVARIYRAEGLAGVLRAFPERTRDGVRGFIARQKITAAPRVRDEKGRFKRGCSQ